MNAPCPQSESALRIFVVENHADTLKYLLLYLEQLGHAVQSARTMTDAIAHLGRETFDVVISDIGLPDGDGWELLRRAHLPKSVFAIAMSGFGMNADRLRSKDAGFRHHLLKPFEPDDLCRMLEEAAAERALHAASGASH